MKRKEAIITNAITDSEAWVAKRPDGSKSRQTAERIQSICMSLVTRPEKIFPTAPTIESELSGSLSDTSIYNRYSGLMNIWQKAYRDLDDIGAGTLKSPEQQLRDLDLTSMDLGTRHSFQLLLRFCHEKDVIIRRLRQQLEEVASVGFDEDDNRILQELAYWIEDMKVSGFDFTDNAVAVSNNTPVGTPIMARRLFNMLEERTAL